MSDLSPAIHGEIQAAQPIMQPMASGPNDGDPFLQMIERVARDPSIDISRIDRLMDMRERVEDRQARKAFDAAMSAAKAQISPIVRNAEGHNKKKYADFAAIARMIDPILAAHGLAYRFRSQQTDKIHVTCIMSHSGGHREETALSGAADVSGNKNQIQALGSTLTYLQRYSLVQMLGLASADDDDGAATNVPEFLSLAQVEEIQRKIVQVDASLPKFQAFWGVEHVKDMRAADFAKAMDMLDRVETRNAAHS